MSNRIVPCSCCKPVIVDPFLEETEIFYDAKKNELTIEDLYSLAIKRPPHVSYIGSIDD